MKNINVIFGGWDDFYNYELEIPEEIKFFFKQHEIGSLLIDGCEHYTTVVETKKYKKWLKYLEKCNCSNIYINEFAKYSIIRFSNVSSKTKEFPIIDRLQWFKQNNIDFSKFVIVTYDEYERIQNACRIVNFISSYNCKYIIASRRNALSTDELYSLEENTTQLSNLYSSYHFGQSTIKIISGKKAEKLWNSMVADILSKFMFNKKYINKSETFETENTALLLQTERINQFD